MQLTEYIGFTPLLKAFLLTVSMSFLLGLGLREYYLTSNKQLIFGSTRSCVFIGALGFVLFQIQDTGLIYIAGLVVIGYLLATFYQYKISQHEYGMIGLLIALVCYTIGPVSLILPDWFLVLYVMAILFVLNAKERIHQLTQTVANKEIITLAKFLVLSGVILPLTPKGPIASFLPVSVYQTWLSVVVISGISYFAYLLQTYFVKGKEIILTGAIGGLYSSTATSVVLARQSRYYDARSLKPSTAIILSTGVMYLRLVVVIGIFQMPIALATLPGFLLLTGVCLLIAFTAFMSDGGAGKVTPEMETPENPLEINAAILFASSFLIVTAITHFILGHHSTGGLHGVALLSGFTDIYPFVLALVQGGSELPVPVIGKAIFFAAASNDLMKAGYVWGLSKGRTRAWGSGALIFLALVTFAYGVLGI